MLIVIRWVAVRNIQPRALTRLAKVMKLTLCTFQLEMLFQDGFMVGIPWTIGMETAVTGDELKISLTFAVLVDNLWWLRLYQAHIFVTCVHSVSSIRRYRFGHLVDLYAWNPHCRYLDGTGPSDSGMQNWDTLKLKLCA